MGRHAIPLELRPVAVYAKVPPAVYDEIYRRARLRNLSVYAYLRALLIRNFAAAAVTPKDPS